MASCARAAKRRGVFPRLLRTSDPGVDVEELRADDPRRIGDYALLHRIGGGSMGSVYLARSRGGRLLAIKVARAELAEAPEFRERFRREVEMARRVGGFWTAAVVDADPDAARPWLATEYVAGPTLHQAVAEHGPLPEHSARRLVAGLAEALAAIHDAGLVHRDLKPANVLLGTDGPRVIDFGISQALRGTPLTTSGQFLGTPGFLSPEQITGDVVGPPSDVFSLGAVLVFATTGRGPFGEGDTSALLHRATSLEPDLRGVPAALCDVATACLRRDPARRPTSAQLLVQVGDHDAAPTSTGWLPRPVRTLVEQHHTELRDRGVLDTTDVTDRSGPAVARDATAPIAAKPARPTRHWGRVASATADRSVAAHDGDAASFRTSRFRAALWGCAYLVAAIVISGLGNPAFPPGVRLIGFVGTVLFVVLGGRALLTAVRRQVELRIAADGIALSRGSREWRLPWDGIARTRVVARSGTGLVVWLAGHAATPEKRAFRRYHGGLRVFPIAGSRRTRSKQMSELGAALAWYGPNSYDSH